MLQKHTFIIRLTEVLNTAYGNWN